MGPCETREMLVEQLKTWAADPTTSGGSFAITKDSLKPATSKRGRHQLIKCHRGGNSRSQQENLNPNDIERTTQKPSSKVECPWGLYIEETDIGWIVSQPSKPALKRAQTSGSNECMDHDNHKPIQTSTEMLKYPGLRTIPEQLHEYAAHLQEARVKVADIYHALVERCMKENIQVTFTVDDIKNKYCANPLDKILDCTNLAKHLRERLESNPDLEYELYLDHDGNLQRIFFVLEGGKEIWKRCKGAVLMYDTKHGTNRYGLKLGNFVTIDENGKTRVIASSFVLNEDVESFSWAFQCFADVFQVFPVVFFTDGDTSMAQATTTIWPTSVHLLCTFHMWKNVYQHMSPLFSDRTHWKVFTDMWWRLCKNSDIGERAHFSDKFNAMVAFTRQHSSASKEKVDMQIQWLDTLASRKHKWAACFTWEHRTYGIHSTQRAEAMHSAIAVFCSKQHTILEIVTRLEQMAEEQALKSELLALDSIMGSTIGRQGNVFPVAL